MIFLLRSVETVFEKLFSVRKNLEKLNEIFMVMEDGMLKSSKQTKGLICDDDNGKSMLF